MVFGQPNFAQPRFFLSFLIDQSSSRPRSGTSRPLEIPMAGQSSRRPQWISQKRQIRVAGWRSHDLLA